VERSDELFGRLSRIEANRADLVAVLDQLVQQVQAGSAVDAHLAFRFGDSEEGTSTKATVAAAWTWLDDDGITVQKYLGTMR